MQLDFVAIVDIPAELTRGCPSTAWNVGNLACHHWILGYYHPDTQREVWDANPDALIASSIALAAGRARKADGGFIVSGRWPFSSGVDNSDWNMLAVTVYGDDGKTAIDWRLCLVPKSDYEIIDTWYAMGLGAAGRNGLDGPERFVPERRALALQLPRRVGAPAPRSTPARCSEFPSWRPRLFRWHPPHSVRPRAPTSCSWHRWPSAPAPTPAPRSPTSRPCRSRSPAPAA
jgi:3-hydroxy-9,10-secoandrosta-1,3,5(10)-triene-9,17-dione monooxygenase